MTRRTRGAALLAIALLAALPAAAATAREMYATASARAKALRASVERTGAPPPLREFRAAAAAFESVVRRHPTTGYADNALLDAAVLLREANERFGEDQDRVAAVRLLNWLLKEYPASPLAAKARDELRRWEGAPVKAKASPAPTAQPRTEAPRGAETVRVASSAGPTLLREIRRAVIGNIVRITIELDAEVTYRSERLDSPPRVLFDLDGTRPGPSLTEGTTSYTGDAVRHIRIGRHPNRVLRVVLDLQGVKRYSVFTLYSPYRIVVDCERGATLPPVATERITEDHVPAPTPDIEPPEPPPPPKPLAGRTLAAGSAGVAPIVRPQPLVWPAAAPPPSPRAPGAAPTPPLLKVTRQFRGTRYPSWQPAVILPGRPAIETAPAVATTAPAVTPASAQRTSSQERPAINGEPPAPPPNGFSMARQLGLGASRIVIDPGHGGHDPGAEGHGVFEAEIVLDVALRLEKLLTGAGIEAVLTRRKDEYIPLEERTAIANRAQGDLFLSIHANASRNRAARGIESYVLNFASTPDAEAVAARENASTGLTMSSLTEIVKAIALNNKLDESRNFAGMIQRELVAHLGATNKDLRNHGVKQAPFVVLIGASMPSVLAEISFITHAQEGRLLKTGAYRQKIAEALFDAIRGYQKSLKGSAVLTRQ